MPAWPAIWSHAVSAGRRTLKAALTMNLSILELQKHLATRHLPLTSTQRNAIAAHPLASVRLLEDHGITDTLWLTAVAQHHEVPGGSGYPHRLDTVNELATLLRHVDIYTARLSPRAMRESQAADLALREMFKSDAPEPVVAAIAREFGMYPPGCHVALASGEIGVVVKRGDNLATPVVAVMFDSRGEPLREPLRRDTALPTHAIVKVVTARRLLLTTHRRRQITAPT